MMNGLKKSDEVIGAMKADSKGGSPPAERLELGTPAVHSGGFRCQAPFHGCAGPL